MNVSSILVITTIVVITTAAGWQAIRSFNDDRTDFSSEVTESIEPAKSEPTPTQVLKTIPTTTKPPTVTPVKTDNPSSLSEFQYPNSSISSQNSSELILTSTDIPDTITNWYKSKIQSGGYSNRSFVTTTSNGNVENVLVGVKNDHEIRIKMQKSSNSQATTIVISQS